MIHPSTELRKVDDHIGYGVFATELIPCGTVVYVKDPLEIEVSATRYRRLGPVWRDLIEKYSYRDERGVQIISWDIAKYVNHSCECNTMSTGYGFEIAIRDILPGEEMTDEYGLLNLSQPMECGCGKALCRKMISPNDLDRYGSVWDEQLRGVLPLVPTVIQPLMQHVDRATHRQLMRYLAGKAVYRSVQSLRLVRPATGTRIAAMAIPPQPTAVGRRLRAVRS